MKHIHLLVSVTSAATALPIRSFSSLGDAYKALEDDYKATLTGLQKDGPDSMVTSFGCRPDYAYIECGRCIQTWGIQSIPIPE